MVAGTPTGYQDDCIRVQPNGDVEFRFPNGCHGIVAPTERGLWSMIAVDRSGVPLFGRELITDLTEDEYLDHVHQARHAVAAAS